MERRSVRITSWIAFAMVVATDVLYVGLINSQGASSDPMVYVPRFVAGYLALMAALIGVALTPVREIGVIRVPMRAAAAVGLLVLGVAAAFSIGPPLVIAGILVGVALSRTDRIPGSVPRWSGFVAALLSVAVLLVGFEITERLVMCPEIGTSEGAGSFLITGQYHYTCANGQLHWSSS
ncbi:MAG TPA: hypothetical protein VJP81_06875 [Candidatus Dormibacteraeota bacterium]|nr:hypothetical protein [Candidatus Dormibacteraeota bacterium]